MKKRIGSLLMALVLALSLVPATVWAADDPISVDTFEELQAAIASDADTIDIVVTNDIELTQELTISGSKKDITIRSQEGSTYKLLRSASFQASADDYKSEYAFRLKAGKLTFQNIILDGNKEAVTAKNTFVFVSGSNDTQLTLGQGATIQNCASTGYGGAVYVSMGKLVMEEGSAIKDCTTSYRGGAIAMIYEPWSNYSTGAITFTMKGATISGCSTTGSANYAQGGAIFTSGRVTMDIQGSTISGNTANGNGGAIYGASTNHSGDIVLNLSGTTITGNTSQKLGGGVYFDGTTFTVSGVTDITDNTGSASANNVYLTAKKTVDASGLAEGSKIGVSSANIPSTLVTGYAEENGYFFADRTETKLTATTDGGLLIEGKDEHTHCICGRAECDGTPEGHRMITCKGVSSLDLIKGSGSYYLLNDVTLTKTWKAPSGITLCLNGHAIHAARETAAINLEDSWGFRFDLTDCGTDGKITGIVDSKGNVADSSGVIIGARATFNLYNGSICDNTLYSYQTGLKAGAVEVNGTFNMYGGSIKNNQGTRWIGADSNYIGGVLVNSTGAFNLYDGEISGNRSAHDNRSSGTFNGGAVYVNGGKFTMTGGVIKNNRAGVGDDVQGDGGAVYITASNNKAGTFKMTGGEISGNTARRNGGGVAVVKGTFEMTGDAKISGNKAQMDYRHYEHKGGGVFVGASGTFTMSGNAGVEGNLVRNGYSDSVAQGAGVYVSEGGTFTMSEKSSLKSNTMTSQYQSDAKNLYGGGVFVGGTMNLNGGSIEDNTAVYEGGGLYLDTKGTVNLGTGTIIVRNNTSEKTTGHNLYLPGAKKLIAPAAPADGSHITLSLPLARIQKAEGTAVIANTGKDIRDGDSRFAFEAEKITLVRDGDGEDVLARIPAHTHDGITYIPVYSLADIPSNATGNYYLLQDAKMSGTVTVGANNTVNVCLNGHKSEPIYFKNSGTLNITDCKHGTASPGYITGYSYNSGGSYNIENASGSTLNLTNVTVKGKIGSTFISATGATVNISGCEYYDSESGFLVASAGSKVTVTDSTFKNNTMRAPTLWFTDQGATTGSFTVKKCTFTGNANTYSNVNYENSRGCAINSGCPGTTLIENCTITKNLSHGDGGGIYLYGKGTATIKNTTVEDNESQWHGGGIAVDSANAPVFTGTVVVKNNKSRISYNAYYQDMTTVVTCNVMIGSIGSRCTITTDSGFNAGASKIGLSAWDIPSLVVSGNTSTKGFFADDSSFVLRPTTSTSGPLLTSGNTGLELWHNGKGHTHCVCGTGENTADSTHTHEELNWIGVTELKDLPAGNYYLLRGYSSSWAPTKDINLCLNGLGISSGAGDNAIIDVDDSNKVAVTDCNESKPGTITGSGWYARDVYVTSGSTFTLWNGKLTGYDYQNDSSYTILNGGGVWMKGGKFVMNGGSISARSTNGHGGVVYMYSGTFIMNAGSLSGKALKGSGGAVYVEHGIFTMNGGTITGKAAETEKDNGSRGWAGHGGAVYGEYATININGGTITGSSAVEGGGIHADKSTLTIGKANITDNTASHGGGGVCVWDSALTMDGATVTGNNGGDSLGGGIYISGAKGNGTASDPYIPAVIKNATIQNNTAKCGGGISTSGPVKISDTTITGNTATKLKNWGGGGLNARIIPKSSNGNGWVFELSGKMNITDNNAEGVVNNLYFPEMTAGTMLPAVTGLTAGSTIGVTTAMDSLQADNTIVPVYITSDKGETGYFTSDKGYIVRLDATQNQLYVIAESYSVSVTLGENMESTGTLTQDLLKGAAMTDVVITAEDGYYFPENYGFTQDGITVRRDGPTQITVTGTPTADASLVLLSATAKATPAAPTGLTGVAPTDWDAADGKISGTKSTMEWSADGKTWTDCTDTPTTVGISGTYYVRIKATDISYASAAAEVIVPKYLKSVDFPRPAMTIFFYDGTEHTLFVPGEDYTVSGVIKATDAGAYKATVTLDQDKYQWSVAPESDTITWLIGRKTALAQDFTFTAPENLIWDGTAKTAAITVNTPYTLGGCNTSLVYKQGDKVVASPTDPGIYQVYLVITGEGNFTPTGPDGFTADAWTFTIQHPAQHIWGDWQHNDTQHYRTCTVPGCTDEERADHETNTPATCTAKAVCAVCGNQYGKVDTHNHPADKVSTTAYLAPTCGSKGHEAYKHCADCGKYFQDGDANLYSNVGRFDIAPLSHKNAVKTDAVAATCTAGGNQAYWHCDDCGSYFADKGGKLDASTAYDSNDTFLLSALGHDYQGQPYQSDSTGHWQICKRSGCGTESTHEDHSGPAATCAAASRCATCGYQLADIDPNNHVSPAKHEAAAPTCTVKGNSEYYSCADCGKFFSGKDGDTAQYDDASTFDIAPLHHKNAVKTDAVAPTCTVGGNQAYWHCGDCGSYFADKGGKLDASTAYDSNDTFLLSALGHDYQGQPYQSDSTGHWQICKRSGCGTESTHEDHSGPAATCAAASRCATCGYQLADIDPNHHVNAAKHEAAAATCTADGNEAYYACADCHKFFAVTADGQLDPSAVHDSAADFTLAKLDHSSATAYPAAAPDCENAGSSLYFRCDYCGKFFGANADGSIKKADQHDSAEDFVLAPLAHKNAVKTDAVAATCTAGGSEAYYTCPDCGGFFGVNADGSLNSADRRAAAQDFATAATGHDLTKTEAQAPTCTETGNSEYYTCATCGKFFSDAEGTNEIAKDSWVIAPTGHDLTKTDAQAPTCTESGNSEYFTCATCGKFFSDAEGASEIAQGSWVIAPTGHDLTKTEAQAPACTESGNSEYYTCAACGKFFSDAEGTNEITKDSWVIAPTGHDLTKTDAQAPTCTESGNSEYFTCATCGKFFSDAEGANEITKDSWVIASLGHDFTQQLSDDAHLRTPASCTDAAEYFYSCSRCGAHSADKFFSSGDALGHAYTQVIDPSHLSTAATCTEDAVYYVSCSRCQANGTETFAAPGTALGHSFTHYIYNNDATYDADGTETAVCDRTGCDATDTRSKTGTKLVDSAAPVVSGVENSGVYCLTVDISVSDPHLDTVTLNGQAVTLTDGKLTVSGQAGTQTLVATDLFGNRTAVTFTVNPDHTPDAGKVVRQPTAAAEGEKVFTCTVCGAALDTEPVAKLAPTVLEGTGSQYSSGSGKTLRFRYDASREDLLQVFVDGVMLRSTQYIVSGDSAVVTLTDSFLQTLSSGTHKLEAVFTTGTASADFTVIASDDHPDVPTGDSGRPILWASLSGVCGLALLALPEIKKRRSHR